MIYSASKKRFSGKLANDTLILSGGFTLRALAQAASFLIVARILGSGDYGAFSAVLALAGAWSTLCGLGGQVVMMRDFARGTTNFAQGWGATLILLVAGLGPLLLAFLATARYIIPDVAWPAAVFIGVGELLFWPLTNATVFAYRGYERMGRSARMILAPVLARLGGALILLAMSLPHSEGEPPQYWLRVWAELYAFTSLLAASYTFFLISRDLGKPSWPTLSLLRSFLRNGIPFSLWGGANKLYIDADKFLLARLASLETAGVYSAGYRLIDLASIPLISLLTAATPSLFRAGSKGTHQAFRHVVRLLLPASAYCLAIGMIVHVAAPVIPRLLGENYQEATTIVRFLAWLPLVSLPRLYLNQALATSDEQDTGMIVLALGAAINLILNIFWIPRHGWTGAAAATYVAEVCMTSMLLISILTRLHPHAKQQ